LRKYGAENIKVLDGLDAVRKVPSMYIGNTGAEGLHRLVYELVDNSVDEALEGFCDRIFVALHTNNSVTVEDNGRGIPVDLHSGSLSALEVVLTKLHAGGKFDQESYRFSAGLHGVGLSVVNALSEYLEVEVRRGGKVYFQRYEQGEKRTDLKTVGETSKSGTKVCFLPDAALFESIEFNCETLARRMREISFLNKGICIVLADERRGRRQEFKHAGGIRSFVAHLNEGKNLLFPEPIYIAGTREGLAFFEAAIQYNDGYHEQVYSFVNNVHTYDGGSHVAGFRSALTRCVNNFAERRKLIKEGLSGDDVKEGLSAVISAKMQHPQFEGQTKAKLGNSETKGLVETLMNQKLAEYLDLHEDVARAIVKKGNDAKKAREAAKKAKELIKSQSVAETGILPGKLADCSEKSPDFRELYIVEGDSAGGSAKQGRDRKTQAVLPLKGKILNVEKARDEKVLSNEEIKAIYLALGVNGNGTGNLRYKKVMIMTDADVDGAHIRTLLLTLFYRRMPELIEKGCLYIAQPPLYRVAAAGREFYIKDDEEFERFVLQRGAEKIKCFIKNREVKAGRLKEDIEGIKGIEKYLDEMERLGKGRALILSLFRTDICRREDFKAPERLLALKEALAEVGYEADIFLDGERNLYMLRVRNGARDDREPLLDYDFCSGEDYRELCRTYKRLAAYYEDGVRVLDRQGARAAAAGEFLAFVDGKGKEGLSVQRYKGLGEMNPEQLWMTTMDPARRTLARVSIEDAIQADRTFAMLMGGNIEMRRAFLEENAVEARNLDV
jgi:DNA gyrase subunit B